jgi:hypothetical protein
VFRSRITRALATAAVVIGFATACGSVPGGTDTGSTDTGSSNTAAADPVLEGAAKLAADAMVPGVQSALQGAGFTNVKVTTEMDDGKAVVTASVGLAQLKSGCALNYESQVTSPGLYFDEVITPQKPEGIEVKGAARNTVTPKAAFDYVLKNHPACLVPNAVAPR